MAKLMRTAKGRISGFLLFLLLTVVLGGVAFGTPGMHANGPTKSPPPHERSESPEAPEQGGGDHEGAQAHTAAGCASGLKDIHTNLPPADRATGLAHAIQVVENNCEKNLHAPGLAVALRHLVTNYERHLAHEADETSSVHGNSADHGQSATHGHSMQHGPSG